MIHNKDCAHVRIGVQTTEFYIDGKPQIYCKGWLDAKTGKTLEECQNCPSYCRGKQRNDDLFEAIARGKDIDMVRQESEARR